MNEIKFFVQGSAPEPYLVVFRKSENNLTGLCNCPAGENGMYCKHRFRILAGLREGIVSENIKDVEIVKSWVKGSDVEKALEELHQAETDLEKMKKKVSALKKKLARTLID